MSGRIHFTVQDLSEGIKAKLAGRTAQNGGFNAVILIQPAKLHSIGGVDHNDNILELFTNAIYHCNLAVTQFQVTLAGIEVFCLRCKIIELCEPAVLCIVFIRAGDALRDIKALAAGTADNNHRCIRVSDRILKNVSVLVLCNGRLRNGEIAALAADLTQTDRTDRTLCTEILIEFHKLLIDFKARMLKAVNQRNRIACITVTGAGAAIQRANTRPAKQVELCTGAQRQRLVIILQQNDALGCNLVCNRTAGCHCFVRNLDILSKNTVHHRVFYAENNPVDGKRDSQQNCNRGLCTHQRALRLF